ncbi:hypothetical protein HY993_00070 [Candidatus Micrarchaeota archaeon]|nr:hypothetical protein [Candidatus Micrarchaeota archaeon]
MHGISVLKYHDGQKTNYLVLSHSKPDFSSTKISQILRKHGLLEDGDKVANIKVEKTGKYVLIHDRIFLKQGLERHEIELLQPVLLSMAGKWLRDGIKSVRLHEDLPDGSIFHEIGMHPTTAWHPNKLVQELEGLSYKQPRKPNLLKPFSKLFQSNRLVL